MPEEGTNVQPSDGGEKGVPQAELERLQRLIDSQERVLRDQSRANAEMTQRMREFEDRNTKAPEPQDDTELNEKFWKNPATATRQVVADIIRDELKKAVGPINDRMMQQKSMSERERLTLQLKERYPDKWDKMSDVVEEFVSNAERAGVSVDENLMNIAAYSAIGMISTGAIPNRTFDSTPSPIVKDTTVNTPAHLRPSAPAAPRQPVSETKGRDLTENERRLARERGMTSEQYLAWLDVPPEGVIHHREKKS